MRKVDKIEKLFFFLVGKSGAWCITHLSPQLQYMTLYMESEQDQKDKPTI